MFVAVRKLRMIIYEIGGKVLRENKVFGIDGKIGRLAGTTTRYNR